MVVLLLAGGDAAAQPCATLGGQTLGPERARQRLESLERSLDRNRVHMRAWNVTWFSLYSTAAAVQGGLALALDDRDDKAVFAVGAGRAAIAAVAIPILGIGTRRLVLTGDRCADLREAEAVMRANVRLHAEGRGWLKHAGVVGLNLAAFLTLGLGFDLWERGALGAGIGVVVGEIQIYTQPMGSRDIARDYERGGVAVVPVAGAESFGLALAGWF